jgi:hypothetical protein
VRWRRRAAKTAGEIVGILAAKGAQSIMMDYRDGRPIGIAFKINIGGIDAGFRLPCDVDGAFKAMQRNHKIPNRYKTKEQSERVAWRILKDWVEAQMAIIECGQAELHQVFLHCLIVGATGQTLFQKFQEDPRRLLSSGEPQKDQDNVIEGRFYASGE